VNAALPSWRLRSGQLIFHNGRFRPSEGSLRAQWKGADQRGPQLGALTEEVTLNSSVLPVNVR
jgi:hypothetical protein